jgi:hypothetical protein
MSMLGVHVHMHVHIRSREHVCISFLAFSTLFPAHDGSKIQPKIFLDRLVLRKHDERLKLMTRRVNV